jgi:hypothetical protein
VKHRIRTALILGALQFLLGCASAASLHDRSKAPPLAIRYVRITPPPLPALKGDPFAAPEGGGSKLPERGRHSIVRLFAVVLGDDAYALVSAGGEMRVVRIGDPVAGTRVVSIAPREVRLDDGTRLSLDVGP